MDLSAVDSSPVPNDGTASNVYANTVEAAQQAERIATNDSGWPEHYGMADSIAGVTPEVLLGHLAAETDSIRLGSGVVLLNHYNPFKVAEQFGVLNALALGRIDAGLGRASGLPAADPPSKRRLQRVGHMDIDESVHPRTS